MIKQLCASLTLALISSYTAAETPVQVATCVACHGAGGVSVNPDWPSLAGQKQGYLVEQITAFRDGGRANEQMAPMVSRLSDADIAALAAYYSAQTGKAASSGDARLVARGHNRAAYCLACHGMQGKTANEEWPNLAGQQARYLESQLRAFQSGARESGMMQTVIANFSPQDLAALAAYFSQLEP